MMLVTTCSELLIEHYFFSMLFIEEEVLSPTNLSPMLLELGKGHKSEGDVESSQSTSQVYILAYS